MTTLSPITGRKPLSPAAVRPQSIPSVKFQASEKSPPVSFEEKYDVSKLPGATKPDNLAQKVVNGVKKSVVKVVTLIPLVLVAPRFMLHPYSLKQYFSSPVYDDKLNFKVKHKVIDAYLNNDDIHQAFEAMVNVVKQYPKVVDGYTQLGGEAERCYYNAQCNEMNPPYLQKLRDSKIPFLKVAINAYQGAINAAPEMVDGYMYLGSLYRKVGEAKKAIPLYEKAVEIEIRQHAHEPQEAHYMERELADTYKEAGEIDKAIAIFTKLQGAGAFGGNGEKLTELYVEKAKRQPETKVDSLTKAIALYEQRKTGLSTRPERFAEEIKALEAKISALKAQIG